MTEAVPATDHELPGRRPLLTGGVAAAWVALDQLSKHWAVNALVDRDVHVIGTLRFNLAYNRGMAFSRGEGLGPFIAVAAVGIVVLLLLGLRTTRSRAAAVATGVVVGGALGNLVDRIFRAGGDGFLRGAVVDFIDVRWWPIFNVADIGVSVGAVGLLVAAWRADRARGEPT